MNEPKPNPDESPWGKGPNPFSDVQPGQGNPYGQNPYGQPGFAPMSTPAGFRGDTINSLAITGLVLSVVGIACCFVVSIAGIAVSVPAYLMAQADLENFETELHPIMLSRLKTSKNLALAGMIVGGIGIILNMAGIALQLALMAR